MARSEYASIEIAEVEYETNSPALAGDTDGPDPASVVPPAAVPDGLDPGEEASFVVGVHAVDPAVGRETVAAESLIGYRFLPSGTTTPVGLTVFPAGGTVLSPGQRFPPDPAGTANDASGARVLLAVWEQLPAFAAAGDPSPVETVEATVTGGLDQAPGADPVVNDDDAILAYNPVRETFQLRDPDSDVFEGGPVVTAPSSGTVEVTAPRQEAGTSTTVEVPGIDLVSEPRISLLSISISFAADAAVDLTVRGDVTPDDGELPGEFDGRGFFRVDDAAPPDTAVESVRFGFSVARDGLDDPNRLVLLRRDDRGGEWLPLRTDLVNETPTAYQYEAIAPGLSTFSPGVLSNSGDEDPLDGTRIRLPPDDPRPDPEIVAFYSDPADISANVGSELDLTGVNPEDYPVTVSDAFRITNGGDSPVQFSLATTLPEVGLSDGAGLVPVIEPGQTVGGSVRIDPNEPVNQLWVNLGVPTLLDAEDNRPVDGSAFPGLGNLVDCQNNANAPVMISESYEPEDTGLDVPVVDDPPGWLPAALDETNAYHRVPAVLNIRQKGEIREEIAVNVPTTDGLDGSLVAVNDREGNVGNDDARGGLGFTFDPEEYSDRSLTRKLDLIFVSEGRCDANTTQATVLDNVGNLSVTLRFAAEDSKWERITGSETHRSGLLFYTPGRSLVERARQLANDAMKIWASKTVSAIFPGGPVRMYRAARAVGGAAPLAGPAVELMALWEGLDTLLTLTGGPPLTPSSVLSSAVSNVAFGGAGNLPEDRFPEFFPGLSNAGISETEIGMSGPALYFSSPGDTYFVRVYEHSDSHPDFDTRTETDGINPGLVKPTLPLELTPKGREYYANSVGAGGSEVQFDWYDEQYLATEGTVSDVGVRGDLKAIHWSATVTADRTGEYDFSARSDDDCWVFIDDELELDLGGHHFPRSVSKTVELAGGNHTLDVFFAERDVAGTVSFNADDRLDVFAREPS